MDLNDFYQQHQIALMRAGAATCHGLRDRMLARAGGLAHDIARFQHVSGAKAAAGWGIPLAARIAA